MGKKIQINRIFPTPEIVERHQRANQTLREAALDPAGSGGSVLPKPENPTVDISAMNKEEVLTRLGLIGDELDAIGCVIENVECGLLRVEQKKEKLRQEMVDHMTAADPETDYSDLTLEEAVGMWQ